MNKKIKLAPVIFFALFSVAFLSSCGEPKKEYIKSSKEITEITAQTTIGSLVEVFSYEAIPVEGYAIVGGLNGTGSADCPPSVRTYLEKYIKGKLPKFKDVSDFIDSPDTAVVRVRGLMPGAISEELKFDLEVTALPGTQTTSLEGGYLWGADLVSAGQVGVSLKPLARAQGAVYIDRINEEFTPKAGYILNGGMVLDDYKVTLALNTPDYRLSTAIRNRLNERFGPKTADSVSPELIKLRVPQKYSQQKLRYIALIKSIYIVNTPQANNERIDKLAKELANGTDKSSAEIRLEAIGRESLSTLKQLLNSPHEEIRLRAGRCMLNMGDDSALPVVREIASDSNSDLQAIAMDTIGKSANRNDAGATLRRLLSNSDFEIKLKAYENLRAIEDIAVSSKQIAGSFSIEQIAQSQPKCIYVTRSGEPRVVIFGAPVYCHEEIFVQSNDGVLTINARPDEDFISIMRKHPHRSNVPPITIRCSRDVAEMVRAMCEDPIGKTQPGLGLPYSQAIAMIEKLCELGAIDAEFKAGELPRGNP